ncbi:hypothetical protein M0802_007543 [Mischocyttarus mexicanus]|nr:hypothetical protein M0802_007543 [Mischocyttarus mexicanus]
MGGWRLRVEREGEGKENVKEKEKKKKKGRREQKFEAQHTRMVEKFSVWYKESCKVLSLSQRRTWNENEDDEEGHYWNWRGGGGRGGGGGEKRTLSKPLGPEAVLERHRHNISGDTTLPTSESHQVATESDQLAIISNVSKDFVRQDLPPYDTLNPNNFHLLATSNVLFYFRTS